MIKTVTHEEITEMMKIMPDYYVYLRDHVRNYFIIFAHSVANLFTSDPSLPIECIIL